MKTGPHAYVREAAPSKDDPLRVSAGRARLQTVVVAEEARSAAT
jgi:hypothetical protein